MTYYEEFGVQPDARVEHIHVAYKTLVRLFHPDMQSDEAVKAVAEREMRRLNGILDTLMDPEKRRAYDASLRQSDPPLKLLLIDPGGRASGGPAILQAASRQWFWILSGLVIVAAGAWYAMAKSSSLAAVSPARVPGPPAPAAFAPDTPVLDRSVLDRSVPHTSVPEELPAIALPVRTITGRDSSSAEAPGASDPGLGATGELWPAKADSPPVKYISQIPPDRIPLSSIEPPRVSPPTAMPAGSELQSAHAIPATASGQQKISWGGNWFYSPQPEDAADAGLYAPAYIQFLLVEEHENLAGNYRARYIVPDKALSAEIGFRAEGKVPSGKTVTLVWRSEMGARGELELTLRTADLLKATWWTTAFGRQSTLASGTATLARERVH